MVGPVWDRLSDELRLAFAWAQAIELGHDLGTRSVLIGMMRARRGDSEPDRILRAFRIPPDELYQALQDATKSWEIDPYVPVLKHDAGEPVLTPNVERALDYAAERGSPGAPLEPAHLLEEFLKMRRSTAYRGLARVLRRRGVPIEAVAAVHREHLASPDGRSLEAMLREQFQRPGDGVEPDDRAPLQVTPDGRRLDPAGPFVFSADGARFAGPVEGGGAVVVTDLDLDRSTTWHAADARPIALALSPGGEQLAAVDADGTVRVLAGRPGTAPWPELHGVRRARALAFSGDGNGLAVADADGDVIIFDTRDGVQTDAVYGGPAPVVVTYTESGDLLTFDGEGDLRRWSTHGERASSRRVVQLAAVDVPPPGSDHAVPARLSAGGRLLVVASRDGTLRVHEIGDRGLGPPLDLPLPYSAVVAVSDSGRLATSIGGEVQFAEFDPPRPTRTRVEWLSDAHASRDLLGRRAFAEALATRLDRMTRAAPGDSFLVHLDGPWGAGKSSILHFLRERLGTSWLLVDFDAWRQSRVGPPWWALLTSLRTALRRELGFAAGAWLRAREVGVRLRRDHLVAPFAALALAGLLGWLAFGLNASELRTAAVAVVALLAAFALLLGYGRGAVSFLMWDSASGARRYEQWHRDPMEGLAEHFAWLVERAPKPVLFLVDDLDRCDERHVVELLDSIQTLVRRDAAGERPPPAPCFVVAADGRWIRRAYERTHEGFEEAVGEPARPLGYLFLDKLFQLSVDVPAIGPDGQSAYLEVLLAPDDEGGAEPEPEREPAAARRVKDSTSQREILAAVLDAQPQERAAAAAAAVERLSEPRVAEQTEHELQKFATVLERNPRSMKRFVNAYSMALSTLLLEGRDVDPDQLALWTILRLRWPELADHLRAQPERLAVFWGDEPVGDEDGALGVLAGTPDLQQVLGFRRGLSPAAVRRLTGTADDEGPAADAAPGAAH